MYNCQSSERHTARIIAYYLPQYYPIPENNEWWGTGFTEWTNVGKAKPLFRGHYQPRVPADLGYYDLRMPETRMAQAEMARNAGIEGFMFWHYWFGNGRTILERPFSEVLRSSEYDFPFCLGWANHSWSNHEWNSSSQWSRRKELIEQLYPGEDDIVRHFYAVLEAFQDHRYITIDKKPVFVVYSPLTIPNVNRFIDLWQNLAVLNGLEGLFFVGLGLSTSKEILQRGFDAINSNGQWTAEAILKRRFLRIIHERLNKYVGGLVLDKYEYKDIISHIFNKEDSAETVFPTIIPNWDRSPRSGRRAVIYNGSTPSLFMKHVNEGLQLIRDKQYEHRILFLKSWNEWAEGNYMEPDLVYGNQYLNVLKSTLDMSSSEMRQSLKSV